MHRIINLLLCCTILLLGVQINAQADEQNINAVKLALTRMNEALHNLTYGGTFIHLHGNRLETLKFNHVVQNGHELERLTSLTGTAQEIRRDPGGVSWMMQDLQTVERWENSQFWPGLELAHLENHYHLRTLWENRIADRPTKIIGIIPIDRFRYGYRFYLDRETGLPLKTDLMDETATPIEQIMFTTLELNQPCPQCSSAETSKNLSHPVKPSNLSPINSAEKPLDILWNQLQLPPGFTLRGSYRWLEANNAHVDHFLLSDGLATVSVYLESTSKGLEGQARSGTINAWGAWKNGHQITTVGEVPINTVRDITEALAKRLINPRNHNID